jgi:hypothetical protein
MTGASTDPRLRFIMYRGYLTACRIVGTLAVFAILFRPKGYDLGDSYLSVALWSILLATTIIQFWLQLRTRK